MNSKIRTDLAVESDIFRESEERIPGISLRREQRDGFGFTTVAVLDAQGARAVGKPVGHYITLELDALLRREENAFPAAAQLLADLLRTMLPRDPQGSYLVIGLGNRDITPDAIGPAALDSVLVTRHLTGSMPAVFDQFRPVSAFCSGVMGTTGIESAELVRAVAEHVQPSAVLVIDALASREPRRLCRTVQLGDTGIVPGSGVGNARCAINRESLGVPVIAIGVPTVVDAATLTLDLAAQTGVTLNAEGLGQAREMIVTPRDIDKNVRDAAKLIGYGVNLALHDGLSLAEIDMFLS